MNREINFRAYYDNRMWFVAKFDLWGDSDQRTCDLAPMSPKYEELYDILLNEVKLMQSTGSKDMNGVEIYGGDILQNEHYFRYQVVFKGDCWRCEPLKNNGFKNRFIGRDLKIIGNIYENPELLKEDTR